MKKYFMISLAALLMAACSNENEPETNSKGKTITIQATIDNGNASRIALGESDGSKTPIVWKVGDKFTLYGGESDITFTATKVESDGCTATFTSSDAPEVLEEGDYSAEYGGSMYDLDAIQAGTRDGIPDYIYMTAQCTVSEGESYDGLSLTFVPQTSIVHAKLSHEAFKGKNVSGISLATPYGTITIPSTFTGSDDGTVEVYFVVSDLCADGEHTYTIYALCEGKYYEVALGSKQLAGNKLYHVTKDMTLVDSPQKILNYQIAHAEDVATLTLTEDLIVSEMLDELNFAALTIPAGKSITINGDGKTISVAEDFSSGNIVFKVNGSLTLKNITLDADKEDVQSIYVSGNVVLEKATVKGEIMVNGLLTLNEGASALQTMTISSGSVVTFNGGTIKSTNPDEPYEIHLDMSGVEEENYIPLVITKRATATGDPLRLTVYTKDANTTQVATVNYTGADANDFKLFGWNYYGEDWTQIQITGGTFSITDGKLMLNAPATE